MSARRERGAAEVHTKPLAPNRDGVVRPEIDRRRYLVVLIAYVALHRTELDEAPSLHCCVVLYIRGGDEVHPYVRSVRRREIREPEHAMASADVDHGSHA